MKIGDRVSTFFRELKRRKVYRVTAVYLVLAIGGLARASALSEGLDAAARGDTPGTRSAIERLDTVEAHFEAALLRVALGDLDRAFSALRSAHPFPGTRLWPSGTSAARRPIDFVEIVGTIGRSPRWTGAGG